MIGRMILLLWAVSAMSLFGGCGQRSEDSSEPNRPDPAIEARALQVRAELARVAEEMPVGWQSHRLELTLADLPVLREALADADPAMRWSACGALAKMSPMTPLQYQAMMDGPLLAEGEPISAEQQQALQALHHRLAEQYAAALPETERRGEAIVPLLVERLSDENADVRMAVIEALRHFGPAARPAVEPLEQLAQEAKQNAADARADEIRLARWAVFQINQPREALGLSGTQPAPPEDVAPHWLSEQDLADRIENAGASEEMFICPSSAPATNPVFVDGHVSPSLVDGFAPFPSTAPTTQPLP